MRLSANSFALALAVERGCVAHGDALAVPLHRGRGRRATGECMLISREDRELAEHFWSKDAYGYARRRRRDGAARRAHREIMGLDTGDELVVDHINGDRLDNRRENLRVCTTAENSQNQHRPRGGSSAHRGVSRKGDRWLAHVTLNRRLNYIGTFDTEDEAARAAAAWRAEHMPFSTN